MRVKLPVEVISTRKEHEYYPKTGEFIVSTLDILKNELGVTGTVSIREKLELGKFFSLIIDTDEETKITTAVSETDFVS